jgi:hypothetical protein
VSNAVVSKLLWNQLWSSLDHIKPFTAALLLCILMQWRKHLWLSCGAGKMAGKFGLCTLPRLYTPKCLCPAIAAGEYNDAAHVVIFPTNGQHSANGAPRPHSVYINPWCKEHEHIGSKQVLMLVFLTAVGMHVIFSCFRWFVVSSAAVNCQYGNCLFSGLGWLGCLCVSKLCGNKELQPSGELLHQMK